MKGFAGTPVDRLDVEDRGVVGDRTFAFRLVTDDAPVSSAWASKRHFVNMVNTPSAVRLRLTRHAVTNVLTLHDGDRLLGTGTLNAPAPLEQALASWLGAQPDAPRKWLRVALTGDGTRTAYHDTNEPNVSLHSAASVDELSRALGGDAPPLSHLRFRSNIVVTGVPAFAEHAWIGRTIALGAAEFIVQEPIVRCVATHVEPTTGERTADLLRTLTHMFGQPRPMVGVYLRSLARCASIERGAPLRLL